jgi:hypothetical protein
MFATQEAQFFAAHNANSCYVRFLDIKWAAIQAETGPPVYQ